MALTATATKTAVSRTLGLQRPFVVTRCLKGEFELLCQQFQKYYRNISIICWRVKLIQFPKTIIYGRTIGVCADIYLYLKECLGRLFCFLKMHLISPIFASLKCSLMKVIKNQKLSRYLKQTAALSDSSLWNGMGVDCNDWLQQHKTNSSRWPTRWRWQLRSRDRQGIRGNSLSFNADLW